MFDCCLGQSEGRGAARFRLHAALKVIVFNCFILTENKKRTIACVTIKVVAVDNVTIAFVLEVNVDKLFVVA